MSEEGNSAFKKEFVDQSSKRRSSGSEIPLSSCSDCSVVYMYIFILLSIAVSEGAAASDIEDLQEKYPFSDEAELYSIQQPPKNKIIHPHRSAEFPPLEMTATSALPNQPYDQKG